ncbi:hypothetical protein M0804_002524 [Polistes exclamans]|nr:hypothetical protein M0804_002524 [Polistes exclamans]
MRMRLLAYDDCDGEMAMAMGDGGNGGGDGDGGDVDGDDDDGDDSSDGSCSTFVDALIPSAYACTRDRE